MLVRHPPKLSQHSINGGCDRILLALGFVMRTGLPRWLSEPPGQRAHPLELSLFLRDSHMSSAMGLGAQNWKCDSIVCGNKAQLSCPLGSKSSSVIPEGVTQASYSICGLLGVNWLSGTRAI